MDFMVYLLIRKEAVRMNVMTMHELESVIRALLHKYHAEYALLFGSYARGEATADSDIDVVVFGGKDFRPADILSVQGRFSWRADILSIFVPQKQCQFDEFMLSAPLPAGARRGLCHRFRSSPFCPFRRPVNTISSAEKEHGRELTLPHRSGCRFL